MICEACVFYSKEPVEFGGYCAIFDDYCESVEDCSLYQDSLRSKAE